MEGGGGGGKGRRGGRRRRRWRGSLLAPMAHPDKLRKALGGEQPPKMHSCPPQPTELGALPSQAAAPGELAFDSEKQAPQHGRLPAESAALPVEIIHKIWHSPAASTSSTPATVPAAPSPTTTRPPALPSHLCPPATLYSSGITRIGQFSLHNQYLRMGHCPGDSSPTADPRRATTSLNYEQKSVTQLPKGFPCHGHSGRGHFFIFGFCMNSWRLLGHPHST